MHYNMSTSDSRRENDIGLNTFIKFTCIFFLNDMEQLLLKDILCTENY